MVNYFLVFFYLKSMQYIHVVHFNIKKHYYLALHLETEEQDVLK